MPNRIKRFSIPRFRWLFATLFCLYAVSLFISTHVTLPDNALPGGSDKIAHFVAYAGLAFLLLLWMSSKRTCGFKELLLAFCGCLLFGAVDELLQIPVGRTCDFYDWLADTIGTTIGILLFVGIRFFTPRHIWREEQTLKDGDEHKL